jgi:serine/threonine protein kinase
VDSEQRQEEIFSEAIKYRDRAERDAYVSRACGNDQELLAKVQGLLHHHDTQAFLDSPPAGSGVTLGDSPLTEGPGTKIGRYKLLQQIGEGGFGAVYMAEQEKPIRRKVALKIIKLGMDTKQVIARFEAERQALAMMEHPNIAKVLDAGATDTGRPYFVMELVKGVPITEYCDSNNFSTDERLRLFIDVCKAVQHAHQKGIIHRDIKPSNVMITLRDGVPVPKVIDFGIAKATQHRLTEKTLFTEYRQFIGTPEYMSPEQAEMSELDVDTRSDIYSLGVLLYELLTGTTPFDAKELRSAAFDEIVRIIRETEPPKPSTRLSTLGDTLGEVARNRHVGPGQLCKIVRGELDWVVMKTLEKDRRRRYETATELVRDIERFLSDEPVMAGPPGAVYRIKKFVRRNRTAVTGVLLIAAALVVGLVLAMIGFVQASRQRDLAEAHRQRASVNFEMAREAVEEMTRVAEKELVDVSGSEQVRRELLQKAQVFYAGFVEENRDDPAAIEEIAIAYDHMGTIHTELGNISQAREAFEEAIELLEKLTVKFPDEPEYRAELAECWGRHAYTFHFTHGQQENIDSCSKRVAILEELVADFPMAAEYRKLLALAHSHFGSVLNVAGGWTLKDVNFREEVEIQHRKAVAILEELYADFPEIPKDLRALATCHLWLGAAFLRTGQLEEAEQHLRKALELQEQLLAENPESASERGLFAHIKSYVGDLLVRQGKAEEAEKEYREVIAINKKLIEEFPGHFDPRRRLGHTLRALHGVLRGRGLEQEAEDTLREAVFHWEKLTADHPEMSEFPSFLAGTLVRLGNMLHETGRLEEAEQNYRNAIVTCEELVRELSQILISVRAPPPVPSSGPKKPWRQRQNHGAGTPWAWHTTVLEVGKMQSQH